MRVFNLDIKREETILATVDIDESTVYNSEFMGMDKISTNFILETPVNLRRNDCIVYNEKVYKIKHAVDAEIVDSKTNKYAPIFYGSIYDMYDVQIMHLGRTKFSYTGTPLEVLGLIVSCLNEEIAGWTIADCSDISEPITFSFDEQSCRTALTQLAEAFKLEYKVDGKAITLLEHIGDLKDITLKYGRGKGLVNAKRQSVDKTWATVWRGYGGTQNLPDGYRDGMDRIALDAPITVNTDIYGRIQGSATFEDVFPRRTSTLTAVNSLTEFIDTTIDFDLNAQQITDGGAKIVFKSGELSGQEFVITGYDHATKKIKIGFNKDETGYESPNTTFSPAGGDKYTLIGIVMPESYVIAAEAEVLERLNEHAAKNSFPPVAFPLNIDEKFIREMGLTGALVAGDSVTAISETLGINTPLRLQSLEYPLVNPDKITGVISDVLQYSSMERIAKDVKQNKKTTSNMQAVALNTRQIADEIRNAAIMQQFQKTYVGDKAILTGAFVAGNPEAGEVAGVNGTGTDSDSVRFWAGSTFADRAIAPYRVLQDGTVVMTKASIRSNESDDFIEISSEARSMSFNLANKKIINIDADSAVEDGTIDLPFEVIDENGNPTWLSAHPVYYPDAPGEIWYFNYTYPKRVAGIQVGYGINDADGMSTIGAKKVFTTGKFEASNPDGTSKTTMSKDGLDTTGEITAKGAITTDNDLTVKGDFKVKDAGGIIQTGDTVTINVQKTGGGNYQLKFLKGALILDSTFG